MARRLLLAPVSPGFGAPDCARVLDEIFGKARVRTAELPTVISRPLKSSTHSEFLALEFASAEALRGAWFRLRSTYDEAVDVSTWMPDCLVRHGPVDWLLTVADSLPGGPSGWDHKFLDPASTFIELRREKFLAGCTKFMHEPLRFADGMLTTRAELKKKEEKRCEERNNEVRETEAMAREEEEQRQVMALSNLNARGVARIQRWGRRFVLSCSIEHLPAVQGALEAAWEEKRTWTPKAWARRFEELRGTAVELWGNEGHGGRRRGVSRSQETPAARTLRLRREASARRAREGERKAERLREERLAGVRCACVGLYPDGRKRRRLSAKTQVNWCNEHRECAPCTRLASNPAERLWPQAEHLRGLWLCKRCTAAYGKRGTSGTEDGQGRPSARADNSKDGGFN